VCDDPGVSGNPAKRFQPGISGNPSGRPKTFSIHQLVAEAIDDKETRAEAVKRVQENLKNRRSVLSTLELAARLNREIGLGSEDRVGGITINFVSNLQPGALRCRAEAHRSAGVGTGVNPAAPPKGAPMPSAHERLKRQAEGKVVP
jgi:hypothetical protein